MLSPCPPHQVGHSLLKTQQWPCSLFRMVYPVLPLPACPRFPTLGMTIHLPSASCFINTRSSLCVQHTLFSHAIVWTVSPAGTPLMLSQLDRLQHILQNPAQMSPLCEPPPHGFLLCVLPCFTYPKLHLPHEPGKQIRVKRARVLKPGQHRVNFWLCHVSFHQIAFIEYTLQARHWAMFYEYEDDKAVCALKKFNLNII